MITFPGPLQAPAALLVALLVASAPAIADDVHDASKLLRSGQHQQALERVNKVLADKPKDAQARFLKGLIFAEQGNTKEATEIFLGLTKDYPDLPEPYNNLAVIYASQGQYDKARGALEQSIRTHPSYATAYENLGDVYAKLASQAYDKALQIDSANPGAKNKLALVRELVGGASPGTTPARPVAVAAAPAQKEPASPAAAGSGSADLIETVNAWAKAWSSRDVDGYLAFYAKDFKTAGGQARIDWEKARRQRISTPKSISVTVDSPKVSLTADGQALVTFRQGYRSDVLKSSTTTKTLVFAKGDGRWLIRQERVGN